MKKNTHRLKGYILLVVACLFAGTVWSWIDLDSFRSYGIIIVVVLIFQPLINWYWGNVEKVKVLPEENTSSVNENIENYEALQKVKKENEKWWQFWI